MKRPTGLQPIYKTNFSSPENQNITPTPTSSSVNLKAVLETPADTATGEYEYSLMDDAGVVSTGLLVVEDTSVVNEYNLSVQYEQYE